MKKKLSRVLSLFVVLTLMMAMLTACGSGSTMDGGKQTIGDLGSSDSNFGAGFLGGYDYESSYDDDYDGDYDYESESDKVVDEETDSDETVDSGRKIIETIDMEIETKEFDELMTLVDTQLAKVNGYVSSSDVYGNSYEGMSNRSAHIVLRVPAEKSDEFINFVEGNSVVTRKIVETDDVTLEYVDIQARMVGMKLEKESLENLLAQAETIDDIIMLQDRLSSVIGEIESAESKLRTMTNLIDYTTITLYIDEVETPTIIHEQTVWEEIATKFTGNIEEIKEDIVDLFIYIVSESPYLLLYAIGIIVIVVIVSRTTKKQKALHASAMAQAQAQSEEADAVSAEINNSVEQTNNDIESVVNNEE